MSNPIKISGRQLYFAGISVIAIIILYISFKVDQQPILKVDTSFSFDLEDYNKVEVESLIWEYFKKERAALISQAEQNGEDLLLRGKFWKLFRPTWSCPYSVERLGMAGIKGDGGKWMCGIKELYSKSNPSKCIVYSFGVNVDSSFEADILNRTNCEVFAYDYTVDKIGPPLSPNNSRVHFQKLGMAGDSKSQSRGTFKTLKQFMDANNHDWIDILKMDVEGAELLSLNTMMEDFPKFIPVGQLQVEFHIWKNPQEVYSETVGLFQKMEQRGLKAFRSEPNPYDPSLIYIDCSSKNHSMAQYEYSFLNTKWKPFKNSSFTFEQLLLGSAINTFLHLDKYPIVDTIEFSRRGYLYNQ